MREYATAHLFTTDPVSRFERFSFAVPRRIAAHRRRADCLISVRK
jgi:hypothetical protein